MSSIMHTKALRGREVNKYIQQKNGAPRQLKRTAWMQQKRQSGESVGNKRLRVEIKRIVSHCQSVLSGGDNLTPELALLENTK